MNISAGDRIKSGRLGFSISGRPFQQIGRLDAQHGSQPVHNVDTGSITGTLKRTDVGPVNLGTMGELFLRQAFRSALVAQIDSKDLAYVHARKWRDMMRILPRSILYKRTHCYYSVRSRQRTRHLFRGTFRFGDGNLKIASGIIGLLLVSTTLMPERAAAQSSYEIASSETPAFDTGVDPVLTETERLLSNGDLGGALALVASELRRENQPDRRVFLQVMHDVLERRSEGKPIEDLDGFMTFRGLLARNPDAYGEIYADATQFDTGYEPEADEVFREFDRRLQASGDDIPELVSALADLDSQIDTIDPHIEPFRHFLLSRLYLKAEIALEMEGDMSDMQPQGHADNHQTAQQTQSGGWAEQLSGQLDGPTVICWASSMDIANPMMRTMLSGMPQSRRQNEQPQQYLFARVGATGVAVNGRSVYPLHSDEERVVVRVSDTMAAPDFGSTGMVSPGEAEALNSQLQGIMQMSATASGLDERAFIVNFATGGGEVVSFKDTGQGVNVFDRHVIACR